MNVSLDVSGGVDKGKDAEELRRLQEENEILRHRLVEVEMNWRKAMDNAKGLQSAQQRLFQVRANCMESTAGWPSHSIRVHPFHSNQTEASLQL